MIMQTPIDDINMIELRKAELQKMLDKSSDKMYALVDELKQEKQPTTKAEHFTNIITKGIAIVDSAYFGWKMYHRFGNMLHFGRKSKK